MAISKSDSTTLYQYNGGGGKFTLATSFTETGTTTSSNTSQISASASLTATTGSFDVYNAGTLSFYWYDNNENSGGKLLASVDVSTLYAPDSANVSATFSPKHKSDGSLSGYVKAVWTQNRTDYGHYPASGSISTANTPLTTIPRQANILTAPNFNDEQNPKITYSNPAGNAVTTLQACISFTGSTDDIAYRNISKTGSSYTFELTDAERKILRAGTSSNSRTVIFYVKTVIGGTTYYSTLSKTLSIINATPDFYDFEFKDINSKTVALTGNEKDVILGYSNVKVTIPVANKAVAKKEATMKKYRFNSKDATYSSTADVSITSNGVSSGDFTVYAIDSRENSKSVTKNATNVRNYKPLTKGSAYIGRENGVSQSVNLSFNGTINLIDFGAVVNSIKTAKYRYTIAGKNSWSDYINIDLAVDSSGNYSFDNQIYGDIENVGFDINNSYNVEVLIEDELSSVTFSVTLGSGIPHVAYAKNGVGIMGKYDEDVGGPLQIEGKKVVTLDDIYPVGCLYLSIDSTNPKKLFGGEWTQITNDAYLKIVTSGAGSVGGTSSSHKIPVASMPSHKHTVNGGSHRHQTYNTWRISAGAGTASALTGMVDDGFSGSENYTNYDGGHTHTVSNTGSGNAYYPYYYGIYVWKRTA